MADMTLSDFLLARIAEDEAELGEGPFPPWESTYADSRNGLELSHDGLKINPARVLAECEAKRRIVELHPVSGDGHCCSDPEDPHYGEKMYFGEPCPTLAALAAIYADHPDYREEWKP